jgi:hypothetical protein
VAHPAGLLRRLASKKASVLIHGEVGSAELPSLFSGPDVAAERVGKHLHAVTNSKHWNSKFDQFLLKLGRVISKDRRRSSRKNQAFGLPLRHLFRPDVVRK